ncbi:MAG: hypothetical protein WAN11_22405 [Syntrophobacteraceae bacterium]
MKPTNKYCEIAANLCPSFFNLPQEHKVFSAYSSHDRTIVEQISKALSQLNREKDIKWVSWERDMDIESDLIFCEICRNIYTSKAVLVELSDLNFNVIFEYGYALGLSKKIHLIVDHSFDYTNIERFLYPLVGIGIGKYDAGKLATKLRKKRFWEKAIQSTPFTFDYKDILDDSTAIEATSLLYLKNMDAPDISEAIENEVSKSKLDLIIDDGQEELNNLVWYSRQIKKSFAVIIDMGLSHPRDNFKHFLKCALIAGLCVSTGRRTLVLNSVHAPKPSDIISIVKHYNKRKEAGRHVNKFLNDHANDFAVISSYNSTLHKDSTSIFDTIDIGEHVAENDALFLDTCFFETHEYKALYKAGYKLVIGRKGTGKSAAFFHFKKFNSTARDLVIHKHFDKFNLNDIYSLAEGFSGEDDKNRIISAFWKFILLHIIADSIKDDIKKGDRSSSEQVLLDDKFLTFYTSVGVFSKDKSITETLVSIIEGIKDSGRITVKQIQEQFYSSQILGLMKEVIGYLSKCNKVICLSIDGLDSNLSLATNRRMVPLVLFNLHEVCSNLFINKINEYSINLFLRRDLYSLFEHRIPERDKVTKIFVSWDDDDLLHMINMRLQANNVNHISDLLDSDINISKLTQKLDKYVYKRPRDYVYLFSVMIHIAQTLRRNKINGRIIEEAIDDYTTHIAESIEGEFMSMPFDFRFGDFLNLVKYMNNDKARIPLDILVQILVEKLNLDEGHQHMLIEFMLKIEFLYAHENNAPVRWNKLHNPESKLQIIMQESEKRRIFFHFHPIVQKLLSEYY